MVTIRTPALCRSSSADSTSSSLSPKPTIRPLLAIVPLRAMWRSAASDVAYFARERTSGVNRSTVSMLCPTMSGFDASTMSIDSARASISEIRSSMVVSGFSLRMASTVRAQWRAPASGRSSRVTDVTTTCFRCISLTLRATLSGSCSSRGRGLPVRVAQNLQLRVHISPMIMKVAVRRLQHSALLGHIPLLHIVCSECPSTIRSTSAEVSSLRSLIFNQSGFLSTMCLSCTFGI